MRTRKRTPEAFPVGRDPSDDGYRQHFIDQTAIALFAAGWPKNNIFTHAAMLWRLREESLSTATANQATANGKAHKPQNTAESSLNQSKDIA